MDGSNLYNLSNNVRQSMSTGEKMGSLRSNSSAIWRNSGMEVFSKSARDEDDEEALKWASIEKLPTFDRLRKGLLLGTEVDIHDLGAEERKKLLERLVNVAEEDNEKFLLKLRNRVDRVGIDLPQIEVRFAHLKIEAEAHVGSRALPSFMNFCIGIVEGLLNTLHIIPSKKERLTILNDVSGIIRPCRMTLLLGPPSSGKTTLLLALAGKLDPTLKFSGRVTYNGHEMTEFVPKKTAAYISQHDLHIGEMTVRETLAFSARCQGVGSRYEMLTELLRREKDGSIKPDPDVDIYMKAAATEGQESSVVTDYVLKVLGLDLCADTIVGNQMIRGISGGQRKRVTTGEILVGPCPERKGVADFLQEVTSKKDQKQYWLRKDEPYRFITAMEFAEGGFVLARDNVAKWWLWGYYSSPMMYGMNAIAVNEFLGPQWNKPVANGTETIGVAILKSRVTMALTYLDPLGKPQTVPPEKEPANVIVLSSRRGNSAGRAGSRGIHDEANENKKKGMILPFEPHSITFDDVKYSVDMPLEMKDQGVAEDKLLLLKGVSGSFRPGVLTALMGVSGAGLDARAAAVVMRTVRNTVDTGRTVVCTIHQPSIDIFEAFDELFLMKRGGEEIYAGPVGRHSCELIKYFEDIEGASKIKDGYNPATWMLEVTASAQERVLGIDFAEFYHNSDLYRRNKALVRESSIPRPGVLLGSMFWDHGSKMRMQQDLFNAMGSMYAACIFLGVQNASSVRPVVDVERTVFYRERAAGMYSALPYAFAQVLVEIPYVFAQAAVYGAIVYTMIGFDWTVVKFFWIYNPTTKNADMVEMVLVCNTNTKNESSLKFSRLIIDATAAL
ncbi:hypothetical protein POM88_038560 [Heracleum sosnowskyi]|uniref:Uncharacterized protein n=1 Tax=Heracleum sosnowskyi TaxID=360622 RepID=A0AAD8HAW8_9APIA|nr:hypothetical protein POM88_038560 [Heracleum sosnowskyi]